MTSSSSQRPVPVSASRNQASYLMGASSAWEGGGYAPAVPGKLQAVVRVRDCVVAPGAERQDMAAPDPAQVKQSLDEAFRAAAATLVAELSAPGWAPPSIHPELVGTWDGVIGTTNRVRML